MVQERAVELLAEAPLEGGAEVNHPACLALLETDWASKTATSHASMQTMVWTIQATDIVTTLVRTVLLGPISTVSNSTGMVETAANPLASTAHTFAMQTFSPVSIPMRTDTI